ncbi:MAG: ABC transporter permease [Bacteroidales bacterium]|nr:ABC transporter permease [Bacteroidales bacterium]
MQVFQAELFKNKNNSGLIIFLLFPALTTLLILGAFVYRSNELETGINYWSKIGEFLFLFYWFYPVIIALAVFSIFYIEDKNYGYKQLFTLPVRRPKIYIAKWGLLILYTLMSVMVAYSSFLLGGHLLDIFFHLGMNEYPVFSIINLYFLRIFLFSLAVLSFQHFFSLLFKHLVLSLGIAVFMNVSSIILSSVQWKYLWTIPYAGFRTASIQFWMEDTLFWQKDIMVALICFILFAFIGQFIFINKKG